MRTEYQKFKHAVTVDSPRNAGTSSQTDLVEQGAGEAFYNKIMQWSKTPTCMLGTPLKDDPKLSLIRRW